MSVHAWVVAVCLAGAAAAIVPVQERSVRRLRAWRRGPAPGPARSAARPRRRWPGRVDRGDVVVDPALVLDLVAAALSAGSHPVDALTVVGSAVGGADGYALRVVAERLRLGAADDTAWAGAPGWCRPLREVLALSWRTGAPATRLLRHRADDVRRRRQRSAQEAAQRLGVQVVLPLGLCALPGFAAWGVVPVVLGLAADVLGR